MPLLLTVSQPTSMLPSLSSVAVTGFAIGIIRLLISLVRHERIKRQMPPGPRGLPFLGNLLQLNKHPWLVFEELKEQYGPIFTFDIAGKLVVVLNDFTVTADLTDRRSGIYSDRPRLIMAGELMSKNMLLPLTPYGDLWRNMRKVTHESFNVHVAKEYRRLQEQAAYRLLGTFLEKPREQGWEHNLENSFAWTMLSITYGLSLEEARQRQDIVHYVEDFASRTTTAAMPGKSWIDVFTFLKYIPYYLNPWKIYGERSYRSDSKILMGLLNEVRSRIAAGVAPKSFCADLIDFAQHGEITENEAAWLCGIMYIAGVETTSSTVQVFFMAMVLYPRVMRRAQEEIDAVVGRDRLPTFDDADTLPYIEAVIREVMRWRPVAPNGLPKRCTQDDFYEGYLIPEGTLIFPNVWAMNRDTKYFDEPDEFQPERFLDSDGKLKEAIPDTHGYSHGSFGSGRRVCVGRDLAQQALFINIATILWGTDISHTVNHSGEPVVPSPDDFEDRGVVVRPPTFPCVIKSRTSEVLGILNMHIEGA